MSQHLISFVARTKEELKDFEEWWLIWNEIEPDNYPLDLNKAEWFDQYIAWCNLPEGSK